MHFPTVKHPAGKERGKEPKPNRGMEKRRWSRTCGWTCKFQPWGKYMCSSMVKWWPHFPAWDHPFFLPKSMPLTEVKLGHNIFTQGPPGCRSHVVGSIFVITLSIWSKKNLILARWAKVLLTGFHKNILNLIAEKYFVRSILQLYYCDSFVLLLRKIQGICNLPPYSLLFF